MLMVRISGNEMLRKGSIIDVEEVDPTHVRAYDRIFDRNCFRELSPIEEAAVRAWQIKQNGVEVSHYEETSHREGVSIWWEKKLTYCVDACDAMMRDPLCVYYRDGKRAMMRDVVKQWPTNATELCIIEIDYMTGQVRVVDARYGDENAPADKVEQHAFWVSCRTLHYVTPFSMWFSSRVDSMQHTGAK